MDPQAVLERLLDRDLSPIDDAIDGGDLSEIDSASEALEGWLRRGGAAPIADAEDLQHLIRLAEAQDAYKARPGPDSQVKSSKAIAQRLRWIGAALALAREADRGQPRGTDTRHKKPLYGAIASTLDALKMSEERGNTEWAINHRRTLKKLEGHLPSGSGVDNGTKLDHDKSTDKKLVFDCSFHHMNEHGFYDGWTEHTVTVTPNFDGGVDVKVSGRDRNGVKDDIAERFRFLAGEDVEL